MSVAHNFEPDVSPIYEDDDNFSYHSVHFSSADTPKRIGRRSSKVTSKTLGTSHLYEEEASVIVEEAENIIEIDDELPSTDPIMLENGLSNIELEENREINSRQIELVDTSNDFVADSTEENSELVLFSTKIILSAGCCFAIKRHLTSKLVEMGAEIQNEVDDWTTHIVVDRYADAEVIGVAMKRQPKSPMMVDVKWIQECIDKKQRVKENDYSMMDCHYLKQTCRRLSSFRCQNENSELDESNDFLNMSSSSPSELIDQIRKLSDRLDALLDHAPIILFAYHSPDCPTRQIARTTPTNLDVDKIRQCLETMSDGIQIKRRRSFGGFVYEQRPLKDNDVMRILLANKDSRDVWEPETQKPHRDDGNAARNLNIINDMRKTMPIDLPTIRETYQKNASIHRQRVVTSGRTKLKPREKEKRKPSKPVRADDSDIESAMASLTICVSPKEKRVAIPTAREPLVLTRSNFINKLLITDNREDDFISDVSALHPASKQVVDRNGVIFTGFSKESSVEQKLRKIARRYKLEVVDDVEGRNTKCVISRHGKRTLLVLKAICLKIPIVRPQWLEESFEDSNLLNYHDYLFDEWKEVLKKREDHSDIFSHIRRIYVADGCQPDRKDICWMIEKCGGKITKKLEKCSIAVMPDGISIDKEQMPRHLPIVTPLFIIDSITRNEYLSPATYSHESVIEIL